MQYALRFAFAVLTIACLADATSAVADDKPNVILVMCDDLGWGDVGFNGSDIAKTPCLDEMAGSSLKFNRFYSAAPVCSPTRGSAITGRHPFRYGIYFANRGHMRDGECTLAEALKTQGYATGHFGKWHLGTLTKLTKDANRGGPKGVAHYSTPHMNGFDVYFSTESKVPTFDPMLKPKKFGAGESLRYGWAAIEDKSQAQPYGTYYWDGEESMVPKGLVGDDSRVIMDNAIPFIDKAAKGETPFLAVIWFHTPHLPVVADKAHRDLYADRPHDEQLYFGCISAMDEQVGRLRAKLRELGIAENTIVFFASDNGPEKGTPGSPGPFRGRKRSLYEGGVRMPGLLEWPSMIPEARETDIPAVTSDYFPTVLDVLGFTMPDAPEPIDGVSLLPLIRGEMKERPCPIGFQSDGQATLNDNRYKLVVQGKKTPEMYDLLADPSETTDIAKEHPDVVAKMSVQLEAWKESCKRSDAGEDYVNE